MNTGTRMTDGCHYCEGRSSVTLPTGASRAQARFTPVLDLRDPRLADLCIELHLHGRNGADELIQTVRLTVDPTVDPQIREVLGSALSGVRIVALYETPPGWPAELRTVICSRLPGGSFIDYRLALGEIPEFCYEFPPDATTNGGVDMFNATVPIAAMWTYPAPGGK